LQLHTTNYVLASLLITVWAIPTLNSPIVARQSGTPLCTQAQIDADHEYVDLFFPEQSFDLISNLTYIVPAPRTVLRIPQTLHTYLLIPVMKGVLHMLVGLTSSLMEVFRLQRDSERLQKKREGF
jgi:hypothetical protein